MKIGIDISQLAYEGTGVARYVEKLVLTLVTIDKKNEYILYGNSLRKKAVLDLYYETVRVKNNKISKKIIPLPQTLIEIFWNKLHILPIESFIGKVDIFHTSDWVEPPAKALKVTTIHDFLVFKYPFLFPEEIVETQKRRISWVIKESNAIIVDSHSTKKDGVELLAIPEDKMFVVYPGVAENFKPIEKDRLSQVLKKYLIAKPYLLSVGTREPRKNIEKVIEAFKIIKKNIDLQLVIVGKLGWGRERVPDDSDIKLLGYVPDEDLQALYSGTACFVYPSLDEGFGFPVLEALACGAKVVTSGGGSLKEVGGKYAHYVDPENYQDIVQGILIMLDKNKKETEESIQWAKSFTWERTAEEVLNIYNKII